eukprot:JP447288.1.p1 GENE.JP447288.1~~JP447288.1.p1  ORF type:complete len:199 (+),score=32.11 JP447288.1:3-599(+)
MGHAAGVTYLAYSDGRLRFNKFPAWSVDLESSGWQGTKYIVGLGGKAYFFCSGLYCMDPQTNEYTTLPGGGWSGTVTATGWEDTLYCITAAGNLWKQCVTDDPGPTSLGSGWEDVHGMTACNGELFVFADESLYRVNKDTGSRSVVSTGWSGVRACTSRPNDFVCCTEDGDFFSFDPKSGDSITRISGGQWKGVRVLA